MLVSDIMHRRVVTLRLGQTCADVATLLCGRQTSSLIFSRVDGQSGIIIEREHVGPVADGVDPASVMVANRIATSPIADLATVVIWRCSSASSKWCRRPITLYFWRTSANTA
jgi:hypothetical protein